jgi:hypothetical protein
MAFQNFSFPQVIRDLGLSLDEANLYAEVPPLTLPADLLARIQDGANLASAINTEKARSEFVIAPVLYELRRQHSGSLGLFSGVELDADAARGLNGVCDFLITREPRQHVVTTPLVAIVEAKNDNLRSGLGQCIAAMVASQIINQQAGHELPMLFGVVTTGTAWKFLQLQASVVTLDLVEYHIENVGKILGILGRMIVPA